MKPLLRIIGLSLLVIAVASIPLHSTQAASSASKAKTFCSQSGNKLPKESTKDCRKRAEASYKAHKAPATAASGETSIIGSPSDLGIPALSFGDVATNVISILTFVAGAISTIFIAVGGIRYSTSNGNQSQIQSAKQTLQYAITGLVVSLLAYSIVAYVLANSPK